MSHRDRIRILPLAFAMAGLAACATEADAIGQGGTAALEQTQRVLGRSAAGELLVTGIEWTAPPGADGADHLALAWRDRFGLLQPLTFPAGAIDARVWRGEPVVLGSDGRLVRVAGRRVEELAMGVVGELAVSDDGAALVYATKNDELGELHVATAAGDTVVARGLQSAGRARFTPDGSGLVFVGAQRGGVAGVLFAPLDGSLAVRALTNGTLRSGRPWGDAFVPPPGSAESFSFDGDLVQWAAEGVTVQRTWRQPR